MFRKIWAFGRVSEYLMARHLHRCDDLLPTSAPFAGEGLDRMVGSVTENSQFLVA